MQHFWFRVLDTGALRRARAAARTRAARIFADAVTVEASAALALEPLPLDTFEIVPATMAVEDERGCNIRARAETLGAILARKAAGEVAGYQWLAPSVRLWSAEWLRIVGAHYVQHGAELSNYLAFVENVYRTGAVAPPDRLVIDFGRNEVAAAYAELATSLIDLPFPVEIRGRSPHPLARAIFILGRQFAQLCYLMLRWLTGGQPPETRIASGGRGIALVGYERGLLDRFPLGTTLDWFEFSGLAPERLVFMFNRSDSPLDEAARAELAERGFGWVDFSSVSRLDPRAFIALGRALLASLRMLPAPWKRAALRRWAVVAHLHPLVHWYRAFVREHRALVLFEADWFTPFHLALNLACRQEEVAVVWSFGSVMAFLEQACRHAFVDLLVAWGDYDLGLCHTMSFDYRYAVKVGIVTNDGAEPDDFQRAAVLRARLTAGPRFVLAVFDSAHNPRRIHHASKRCAEFYRVVLDLMRSNKDWGCIIKSKARAYDDLPLQCGLQDVVTELEAEGRCVRLPNATKPTLVSLAADAIVCYSVNSAGILGALGSGRPVLHYDNNHLFYHPLVKEAGETTIFRDGARFAAAIQRAAAGDSTLGDISRSSRLIDVFGDGMGRKRSAEIIRGYIAARDRGLGRDAALRETVNAYWVRYGADFATTRMVAHDSDADRLWQAIAQEFYAGAPPSFPFTAGTLAIPPLSIDDGAAHA